ncbi:alkyl hydroperoxide reductase subunit F [Pseudomonas sp. TTU2014-096BSC]|nr:alkyl hydroperoxide reductase subunit F [Pseudomonas sp. TTU2014-096BSC]
MLDSNLKTQLKAYLEKVTQPFEIVASLDDGEKSQEMLSLLQDIASLSDKITLKTDGQDARKPSFSLNRIGGDIGLRFAGLPMGHEFTSLVLALLQVGGHPSKTVFGQGRMGEEEILAKLDTGAAARDAEKLNAKDAFDVLVIGGGPAGAAAAIYAARKGIRTGVAAERFGGQVLDTMAIENFISVKETEGPKLARALEEHVREYDVDIMNLQRAAALIPAGADGLHEVKMDSGASLKARTLILATGARWREMNVPGEQEYRGRGVAYCPHCDGPLFKGKRVAVIGGGNSGVEAAIDLAGIVAHVTLLEFGEELRADAVLQRKLQSLANVTILKMAQTTEVKGDGQKVTGLVYKDRTSEALHEVQLEGIFVQIGLLPNSDWLKGTVELSRFGEIIVDAKGQTSIPGVFAAGDVTTVPYKQIVIAVGEGAKASLSAFDHLIRTSVPA